MNFKMVFKDTFNYKIIIYCLGYAKLNYLYVTLMNLLERIHDISYSVCSIDREIGRTGESMDDTRPEPEEGWPLQH